MIEEEKREIIKFFEITKKLREMEKSIVLNSRKIMPNELKRRATKKIDVESVER